MRPYLYILILTFLICKCLLADDRQTVVLLTSSQNQPRFSEYEEIFRKYFEPKGYDVLVQHKADQFHLWKALHSYQNVAVFWLSHEAHPREKCFVVDTDKNQRKIIDFQNFNVTPVFQEAHPNLRILAVISCYSNVVMPRVFSESLHPNTKLLTFSGEIDGEVALRQALVASDSILKQPSVLDGYDSECIRRRGLKIRISSGIHSKSDQAFAPAMRFESNQDILGVIPAHALDSTSEDQEIYFSEQAMKFSTISALNIYTEAPEFREVAISGDWEESTWNVSRDGFGRVLGNQKQVFHYQGQMEMDVLKTKMMIYEPFECKPMPRHFQIQNEETRPSVWSCFLSGFTGGKGLEFCLNYKSE